MGRIRKKKGRTEWRIGLLLIAAALCLTGYNLRENSLAGSNSREALVQLREALTATGTVRLPDASDRGQAGLPEDEPGGETEYPDYVLNPRMDMPARAIDGLNYMGVLDIPALGLELPVLSDYVFDHLKAAPCRFSGSAYTDDLVICAHNYTSHFGRLGALSSGDAVILTDMDGNVFSYAVREIIVLNPAEPEAFIQSGYDLTLFTCTLDGTARLAVRCART